METKFKSIVPTKGTEWTAFNGEDLPLQAQELIKANNISQYGGCWCIGAVFYKGDLNTTKDWIFTVDDGGFYKVDAIFMVWYFINGEVKKCNAIWSGAYLKKAIKQLITTGEMNRDPGYQS
jgi:hypothetical protein